MSESLRLQVGLVILSKSLLIYAYDWVVNLAFALAMKHDSERQRKLRVGLLDLDIFGPSIPKLMGLDNADEPRTTDSAVFTPYSSLFN